MCGRFGFEKVIEAQAGALIDAVRPDAVSTAVAELLVPRYNIAPSQPVIAARTRVAAGRRERRLDALRWGLVPSWANDPRVGRALFNARAETVDERPAFRGAWHAGRRCLVFADLFYEWRADGGTRRPYAVRMADDAPFAFAGLWEAWRDPHAPAGGSPWMGTCTLVTTTPNTLVQRIHDRMPVIVPREHYDAWLDPALPLADARALLAPYAAAAMRAYPVSPRVNDPRQDDPAVLTPLAPDAPD